MSQIRLELFTPAAVPHFLERSGFCVLAPGRVESSEPTVSVAASALLSQPKIT
jgi:hypothetical protein